MSMLPFNELLKHVHYLSSKIDDKRLFGKTIMDKTLAIYKMAKQKLIVTQKEMILHLEIPVVGETFECEKLFAIKHKLQLDAEYILTNNNSYYKMTEADRQQCTAIETVDICNMRTAMYKVTYINLCEYNVRNGSYMNCKFQATKNAEKWIKLQNNAWLFSVTEKTQVNISCNNREETIYLNGAGKIQLNNECSIETKNRKIEKHIFAVTEINMEKIWRTIEFNSSAITSLGLTELNESMKKMSNDLQTYRIMNIFGLLTALAMLTLYYGFAMAMIHLTTCCRLPRT